MSLAGTALPSPKAAKAQLKDTNVSILVIESFASTPLGPRIIFANEQASTETGYETASLVGSPLGLIYDRADLRKLIEKLPLIANRTGFCWMDRILIRNGGTRDTMHWTIRPTQRENGTTEHFTLTFSAIASKPDSPEPEIAPAIVEEPPSIAPVDFEEDLQETRSESLAMAAGGVAHDFKNALQAIKSNLEIAKSICGSHPQLGACLGDADHALSDAETLARQMLAFTRGDQASHSIFNLADLVSRVSGLCTAGSGINCHLYIEPLLRLVEGDPNRVYQVLHNLVINACQAMPNGGHLNLTAGNADLGDSNPFQVKAGSYTVVSVKDRGCGIPPEVLPRIFEKNFSTKENGSGFGLASCQSIIREHGGVIRAASKVGVGTEFLVFLPACEETPFEEDTSIPTNRVAQTNRVQPDIDTVGVTAPCRVLIVEDQPGVLKATQGILRHLGHDCLSALNGEEAVSTYRRHIDSAEPIDVVLLDMTLPGGLNGLDVFHELRKTDPHVQVIATSGYFDDSPSETFSEAGFSTLLAKPFSMQDLSSAISLSLS